PYLGLRLGYAC
ncbi:phage tail fiber repeat protein, partial [Haemophilus influenzae]